MKEKKILSIDTGGLKYFCKDGWCNPKFVVMEKPDDIPDPLRKRFFFTDKHEGLLKWLRGEIGEEGRPKIKIRDVLAFLPDVEAKNHAAIWEFAIKRRDKIDEGIKQEFKEKEIFLYDNVLYAPIRILIAPRGGTGIKHIGRIGEWLSLDSGRSSEEIDTLLALGALEFDTIFTEKNLLLGLLASFVKENPQPGKNLWSDYISIISTMIDKDITIPPDLSFVPIRRDYGISFKPPNEVLLKDDSGIWELFKDDERLYIFDSTLLSKEDVSIDEVKGWLRRCGARDLKDVLRTEEEPELDNAQQEMGLTERNKSAFERLVEIVTTEFEEKDCHLVTQKIEGVKAIIIYSCENITRRYSIDMTSIDGGVPISREITADHYFDKGKSIIFVRDGIVYPMAEIEEIVKKDFNPGFKDKYRKEYWEGAVRLAFSHAERPHLRWKIPLQWDLPDIDANIKKLNDWWAGYISDSDKSSFPTLDGNFWGPALGLDDDSDEDKREGILRDRLVTRDRKLMFNIFSMATLLGTNVGRTQIRNFLEILNSKGLSFSEMYEMKEEDVLRKMIDDMFKDIDSKSLMEKVYPQLRRRIFDILVLRRAMKDEEIGENIMEIMATLMEDGLSPENFLTTGREYASMPFMKGFKGMFTGQIYFIVREMVRLGRKDDWQSIPAERWQNIAFHAPSQVRDFIYNIGGVIPSKEGWREEIARYMIRKIKDYKILSEWYDIPFFLYCDEFCRHCWRGNPHEACEMECYQRW